MELNHHALETQINVRRVYVNAEVPRSAKEQVIRVLMAIVSVDHLPHVVELHFVLMAFAKICVKVLFVFQMRIIVWKEYVNAV